MTDKDEIIAVINDLAGNIKSLGVELRNRQSELIIEQIQTNSHLAQLNGTVAEIKIEQDRHCKDITRHEIELQVLKATTGLSDEHEKEKSQDAKEERIWLRDNIWKLLAGGGGVIAVGEIVTRLLEHFS